MSFFTQDQVAALSATTVRVALLSEFDFATQTMRLWNGEYTITSGGHEWEPMHGMGSIDGLSVSADQSADNVTFTLSGVDASILASALEETPDVNQRSVRVFLQLFDGDWQPIGAPIGIWWGFLQPPKVTRTAMQDDKGGTQTVSVSAENAFFNRSRPPSGRYTDRDQQKRAPGDKFLQFISSLLFKVFTYPSY